MKRKNVLVLFLFGLMLLASCGTELPDNLDNFEVKKGYNSSSQVLNIPAENDNPLPVY